MVMRRAASSVDRAQFLPLQASIGPMFQVALDESLMSDYPPHRRTSRETCYPQPSPSFDWPNAAQRVRRQIISPNPREG